MWRIACVRSRQEHRFAELMTGAGFDAFLPCERVKRVYPNRTRREFLRPVFPGYCFFFGPWSARDAAWATRTVWKLIEVRPGARRRLAEEVERLKADYAEPPAAGAGVRVGTSCEIVDGAYRGFAGAVRDVRNRQVVVAILTDDGVLEVEVDVGRVRGREA